MISDHQNRKAHGQQCFLLSAPSGNAVEFRSEILILGVRRTMVGFDKEVAQPRGPKLDEQELAVLSAHVAPDRRRVFLEIAGLLPGHVVHLRLVDAWRSAEGRAPWSTETWYTLNAIPAERPGFRAERPPERPRNVLSDAERAAGWQLLFDGATLAGWHRYDAPEVPPSELEGWNVRDGAIERGGAGELAIGDLVTDGVYEDFELVLEWKVSPGGNSGVFFHVEDGLDATWLSGPEVQVLDNAEHADGKNPVTSAGSAYALYAPLRDVTRPVGLWNEARLLVQDGRVTHWLNGVELLSYRLGDADWLERVAASKFAAFPRYGRAGRGRIALQDHGDAVWFRDVKLRTLE
jgi:cytochrome c